MTIVIKSLYPQKRITRLCWLIIATTLIGFWTFFLYSYAEERGANNGLIGDYYEPAGFQQTKIKEEVTLFTNMQLKTQQGHNSNEIHTLLSSQQVSTSTNTIIDLTVFIQEGDELENQIIAILSQQSMQPKSIYVLYIQETTKERVKSINSHVPILLIKSMVPLIKQSFFQVRDAAWLVTQPSASILSTKYIWILEPTVIPDYEMLYYTYTLSKTAAYKNSLIGFQAGIFHERQIECFQTNKIATAKQVDMIHGSWFLPSSWLSVLTQEVNAKALDLPLAYFISSSLLYKRNVSSVVIPSKLQVVSSPSFCSSWNDAVRYPSDEFHSVLPGIVKTKNLLRSSSLVLLVQDYGLMPLICELVKYREINVVLINAFSNKAFQDTLINQCAIRYQPVVHDITTAYNRVIQTDNPVMDLDAVTRLLEFIQPQVVIQIKTNELFYRSIETVTKVMNIATISLPLSQIKHILWISDLTIEALKHWHDVRIELVVVTDRRPESLSRLLRSLNRANYLGDEQVELSIHMEQSADSVTQQVVKDFQWQHGNKKVRHRIRKGGLMPAIVESWYPSDNNHYGVLLEDDIELSQLFYVWAKYNILKYRYSNEKGYKSIYGVSLYSPRNLELLPEGRRPFDPAPVLKTRGYDARSPYATQIPCSWGAVYFPEHWRMFHTYLTERIEKEENWKGYYNITVPQSRSSNWSKSWKKYFIELTYLRGYVMVYPNFKGFESFSTNHLEYGTHVKDNGRTNSKVKEFMVPLMEQDSILQQLPQGKLPLFGQLPLMDLWGRVKTMGELKDTGSKWHTRVSTCPKKSGFDPSDILCPFEENVLKAKKKKHVVT